MTGTRRLGGAVAVNLAATLAHGAVHASVPVAVAGWQAAAVAGTVVAVPLGAVALVRVGRRRAGFGLAALAGVAALTVEGLAHFVVANPDHVGHVGHVGRRAATFPATAALSTLGDALVAGTAWVGYSQRRRSSPTLDAA